MVNLKDFSRLTSSFFCLIILMLLNIKKEVSMSDDLKALEIQRERLYQKVLSFGDFRRGSISATFGKCGKKNCACAAKDHPGHGPHYRWTMTRKGKSLAQHLRLGPELEVVQKQVDQGSRFQKWYEAVLEINEKICRLRPVPEIKDEHELEVLKKKLRAKFAKKSRGK